MERIGKNREILVLEKVGVYSAYGPDYWTTELSSLKDLENRKQLYYVGVTVGWLIMKTKIEGISTL